MSAGTYDITIDQGSDFALSVTVSDDGNARNLSDWDARAKLKATLSSTDATTMTVSEANAADGILVMSLSHTQTAALAIGSYVYDLEIYKADGTKATRLLQGRATVRGEVTN